LEEGLDTKPLKFGVITDVHQDLIHDASARVTSFGNAMNEQKADFICQLGDFCIPHNRNRNFMNAWNSSFQGPRYHVIGNHDMDGGKKKNAVIQFWGMESAYYSFDQKGVHFIVLDGNEVGGKARGYKRFISKKQINWIGEDLKKTQLPTVVLVHQPLDGHKIGIENHAEVRQELEAAKNTEGNNKVIASFCGHNHDDYAVEINGIHYIRINSSSYSWLGGKYKEKSYSDDIHKKYKWLQHTAPYKDAIWAEVEINPIEGKITIKGQQTSWVGKDPWQRGMSIEQKNPKITGPRISNRTLDKS